MKQCEIDWLLLLASYRSQKCNINAGIISYNLVCRWIACILRRGGVSQNCLATLLLFGSRILFFTGFASTKNRETTRCRLASTTSG